MTSKKINAELKKKSADELAIDAAALKKALFDLNFKHATRQLTDLMSIRKTRRNLARTLTFASQKLHEAAGGKPKKQATAPVPKMSKPTKEPKAPAAPKPAKASVPKAAKPAAKK